MHVAFLKFSLNARFFNICQKGCSKTEGSQLSLNSCCAKLFLTNLLSLNKIGSIQLSDVFLKSMALKTILFIRLTWP